MTSLTGSDATLRRRLFGVLTATGLGGAMAVVLVSAPAAGGANDPCAASEMARTISNVARSAGDYLDGHPETNQAMTSALQQQQAGPQSVDSLRTYFAANPKAASDLQTIALPLAGLSSRCQTPPISLPQALGFSQSAQGGSPGAGPAAPPVSAAQGASPRVGAPAPAVSGSQGALPAEVPILGVVK
jgi:heme-binding protein